MQANREYEQLVHRDLWWKNFDSMTEAQRIDSLQGLLEQYYNKCLDEDAILVPMLSQADITRKLKSLAI